MQEVSTKMENPHHVCKLSHAQAEGLDALVGHDVVHQHQFAVAEPDLPALGLLCWTAVGPPWKARNRYGHKHSSRSRSATANDTHRTSASRRGTPCLPGRRWHIWPQPGEQRQQQQPAAAASSWVTTDAEKSTQVRDDTQEASAVSSWHSLRHLSLFSLAPTPQEACTVYQRRLCASYLPVCVGVSVIAEEQPKPFFIHSLSYELQHVQSGGCQQLVERSLTAGRNHKRKADLCFTVKLCWPTPAFHLHTTNESHQSWMLPLFHRFCFFLCFHAHILFSFLSSKIWADLIVRNTSKQHPQAWTWKNFRALIISAYQPCCSF